MERAFVKNAEDVAKLLGLNPKKIAVCHSFVSHDEEFLIRDPYLDAYLGRMGARWSWGCNTTVLTSPLLPGVMKEHLEPLGITPNLIEVERYRQGDPAKLVADSLKAAQALRGKTFISAFTTTDIAKLGKTLNNHEASVKANSKVAMRLDAPRFEFSMLPGNVVYRVDEVFSAAEEIGFPLWLKADGSGGDYNRRVETLEELPDGISDMITRVARSYESLHGDFVRDVSDRTDIYPELTMRLLVPFVVEADVSRIGRILSSFCWQFLLTNSSTYEVGCSTQMMSPDSQEWWGGTSDNSIMEGSRTVAVPEAEKICEWFRSCGLRGLVGPDGFLIAEHGSGKLKVVWVDPNGRPAISTTAFMLQNALTGGEGGWVNTNLTLPEPIRNFANLLLLENLPRYLKKGGHKGVQAVLLASRWEPGMPSNIVKMLFISRSGGVGACKNALAEIQYDGIKVGS